LENSLPYAVCVEEIGTCLRRTVAKECCFYWFSNQHIKTAFEMLKLFRIILWELLRRLPTVINLCLVKEQLLSENYLVDFRFMWLIIRMPDNFY
jgi:hypothetical protein